MPHLWIPVIVFTLLSSLQISSAYYDPTAQRWLNRDPIDERGGINLFAYVRNEPAHTIDPFGEQGTNFPIINPPIQIPTYPPPNPWPSSPISADAGKGGVTIHSGNAPVACPASPSNPCSNKGEKKNATPTAPTGVTCSDGRPQKCFEYEECKDDLAIAKSGTVYRLSWKKVRKCNCD